MLYVRRCGLTKFCRTILDLCDQHDKAKDLCDYFKQTLVNYIQQKILPSLKSLDESDLLTVFVKQWQNYTILVHFMRKMFNYLVSALITLPSEDITNFRIGTT